MNKLKISLFLLVILITANSSALLAQVTNAEGFYIEASLSSEAYTMTLFNTEHTTYHSIDTFNRASQTFDNIAVINSSGEQEQSYSLPLSIIQRNDVIIRVFRESIIPVDGKPNEPTILPETTYLYPTIEKLPATDRGTVLILVDYSIYPEIADLLEDSYKKLLLADGYKVLIKKAPRAEEFDGKKVAVTKSIIKQIYDESNGDLESVLLLGRIPHPYSGNYTVDGHEPDHVGAWPADSYYGDMDGEWDDFSEYVEVSVWERMFNVPGDGKFDYEFVPDSIELAIGRVDFYDMPTLPDSEIELYRRYLNKVIDYRSGRWDNSQDNKPRKLNAIFEDAFNVYSIWFPGFSVRSFLGNMVGKDNMEYGFIRTRTTENVYDFAYGGNQGGGASLHQIAYTEDFAVEPHYNRFTQFFGSFLGDIGFENNLMRAVIASNGQTLSCNFGGRPIWLISEMMNGAPLADVYLRTINNKDGMFDAWGNAYNRGIHILLLGDPTLRAGIFKGPSLTFNNPEKTDYTVNSDYNYSSYYIYRLSSSQDSYELLEICPDLECAESFQNLSGLMIKGEYLIENNFGSHYRLSAPLFFPQDVGSLNNESNATLSYSDGILQLNNTSPTNQSYNLAIFSSDGRIISQLEIEDWQLSLGHNITKDLHASGLYHLVLTSKDVKLHKSISLIK